MAVDIKRAKHFGRTTRRKQAEVATARTLRVVMDEQGRSGTWLAGRIGYDPGYTQKVIRGVARGSKRFHRLAQLALGTAYEA